MPKKQNPTFFFTEHFLAVWFTYGQLTK